jgi:hypothetical protein
MTEVTPEMIEAGVEVYCDRDFRFEDREDLVVKIYTAMAAAEPKRIAPDIAQPYRPHGFVRA